MKPVQDAIKGEEEKQRFFFPPVRGNEEQFYDNSTNLY